MGADSKIEWTKHTFNPWRGCTKVSQGCKFCYAETLSARNPKTLGEWGPRGTRVIAAESYWRQPLKWNAAALAAGERHRVFCASLADVFEGPDTMPAESWPLVQQARNRLFELILDTPELDWLLLTKRPENILRYSPMLDGTGRDWWRDGWPTNIWIGTSVENQEAANERIPHLLKVPAAVRFLSCEPLLGPVNFDVCEDKGDAYGDGAIYWNMLSGHRWMRDGFEKELQGTPPIHWVIAGGESGPKARPMHPDWARSLRDQCQAAGVAFHFKQWGEYRVISEKVDGLHLGQWAIVNSAGAIHYGWKGFTNPDPAHVATAPQGSVCLARIGKKTAGRLLDGRTWDEVPA